MTRKKSRKFQYLAARKLRSSEGTRRLIQSYDAGEAGMVV